MLSRRTGVSSEDPSREESSGTSAAADGASSGSAAETSSASTGAASEVSAAADAAEESGFVPQPANRDQHQREIQQQREK